MSCLAAGRDLSSADALHPAAEMPKLVEGLRLLNQADPCVETLVQETGEHVILCAGELHLEVSGQAAVPRQLADACPLQRCLKDLRERFARIAIQASKPLVPFRETAVRAAEMPPPKTEGAQRGTIVGSVAGGLVQYSVRAVPLPEAVLAFLLANTRTVRTLLARDRRGAASADQQVDENEADTAGAAATTEAKKDGAREVSPEDFWPELDARLQAEGPAWKDVAEKIWAFGPRRVGPNFLVDAAGLSAQS